MPPPPDSPPDVPPRLVCRCLGVSSHRIVDVARSAGLTRLDLVQAFTRAGTACGTCHPEIREILCDLAGAPYPDAARRENRRVCQSETETHIERALLGRLPVAPPGGASLEVIAVQGLRVDLRLAPDDPAARAAIEEKLRKWVCAELDVRFSR
jgi:NifU-like protein